MTSPTMLAQLAAARTALPEMRHVSWEPFDDDAPLAAARAAFGRPLLARPRLQDADVVLLLDADPLGPGPEQIAHARNWSDRRRKAPMHRLYSIEASPSLSGSMVDRRQAAGPRDLAAACHVLAAALGGGSGPLPTLPPQLERLVRDAARDLKAAHGRALVIAGERQPEAVHAFAAWANGVLAAPQDWIAPVSGDVSPTVAALPLWPTTCTRAVSVPSSCLMPTRSMPPPPHWGSSRRWRASPHDRGQPFRRRNRCRLAMARATLPLSGGLARLARTRWHRFDRAAARPPVLRHPHTGRYP
ncbi:molybdopterin-binding domain-containing protein [Novosphingobium panipatense]|uniref:hypothetical protein n=1 Tax=Novosphingobium panipatense TaxID=428991 RepID=UPI0036124007